LRGRLPVPIDGSWELARLPGDADRNRNEAAASITGHTGTADYQIPIIFVSA